jgi:hypothetical protein
MSIEQETEIDRNFFGCEVAVKNALIHKGPLSSPPFPYLSSITWCCYKLQALFDVCTVNSAKYLGVRSFYEKDNLRVATQGETEAFIIVPLQRHKVYILRKITS